MWLWVIVSWLAQDGGWHHHKGVHEGRVHKHTTVHTTEQSMQIPHVGELIIKIWREDLKVDRISGDFLINVDYEFIITGSLQM